MKAKFSLLIQHKLRQLHKKDKKLVLNIQKQIALFESNPKHPSLRTHKLTGNLSNRWSISVSRALRMIYIITEENTAYFVDLGTHDEVYRK
jgi:addiction module RelE/StbE family toxin